MLFLAKDQTVPQSVIQTMLATVPNAYAEILPLHSFGARPDVVCRSHPAARHHAPAGHKGVSRRFGSGGGGVGGGSTRYAGGGRGRGEEERGRGGRGLMWTGGRRVAARGRCQGRDQPRVGGPFKQEPGAYRVARAVEGGFSGGVRLSIEWGTVL